MPLREEAETVTFDLRASSSYILKLNRFVRVMFFLGGVGLLGETLYLLIVTGGGGLVGAWDSRDLTEIATRFVPLSAVLGIFPFLMWEAFVAFGPGPVQMDVDGSGLALVYGSGKTIRIPWNDKTLQIVMRDFRNLSDTNPLDEANLMSDFSPKLRWRTVVPIPGVAFDLIKARAAALGLRVEEYEKAEAPWAKYNYVRITSPNNAT